MKKNNNNRMELIDYLICINIVVLVLISIFIYEVFNEEGCESCKLYNPDVKFSLNGIYHAEEGYYCVWTEGKTPEEINRTDCHEYCHYLTDKVRDNESYEHFCRVE